MIRNIIFLFVFYFGLIFLLILFTPSLILPQYIVTLGGKFLGYWASFCLKYIMATKIEVKGTENIINNQKYFVVCSHQSIFETLFLQTLFKNLVHLFFPKIVLYISKLYVFAKMRQWHICIEMNEPEYYALKTRFPRKSLLSTACFP